MTEPDALPDPPLIDRQLLMLGELAELGLEQARALDRRIRKTDPEPSLNDLQLAALAYTRVSRSVRQTIMLQSRVAGGLEASGQAAARRAALAEARAEAERGDPEYLRKARVERVVERLAKAEHPDDEDRVDALVLEAGERLDDEDVYGDLLDRPMSEIVARICKDLDLSPDWSELAQEMWARAEVAAGAPGWPLASRARARAPAAGPGALAPLTAGPAWDGAIRDTS